MREDMPCAAIALSQHLIRRALNAGYGSGKALAKCMEDCEGHMKHRHHFAPAAQRYRAWVGASVLGRCL